MENLVKLLPVIAVVTDGPFCRKTDGLFCRP